MFQFAYRLDGGNISAVNDVPLSADATYKNGVGTNSAKKGDLVNTVSGSLVRVKDAATPSASHVLEDQEFVGITTGGRYASVNSSYPSEAVDTTKYPNGMGKARPKEGNVFLVGVSQTGAVQTATNAMIGVSYGIKQDAAGDQTVDLNNTANLLVKVVRVSADGKSVYVTIL